jgi:hypothetical protein
MVFLVVAPLPAQDVTPPAEVRTLTISRLNDDLTLFWSRVSKDVLGNDESRPSYEIYRDDVPSFRSDRVGGTNRIATPTISFYTDNGAAEDGTRLHLYLVGAVDEAGNAGNLRPSRVLTPPVLEGTADFDSLDLTWSGADPLSDVVAYKVYYGRGPSSYTGVQQVDAPDTQASLSCLEPGLYYLAVTALDDEGNESAFSNEISLNSGGMIVVSVLEEANITPSDHTAEATVDLPAPDAWTRVIARLTADSRLTIPCSCSGGGECGGDPWDRTISVWMENPDPTGPRIELIHAITPFGTDARTGPRVYEMDVTPLAPLLTGTRDLAVNIGTWVGNGWFVHLELEYVLDPCFPQPKPMADGLIPLYKEGGVNSGNQDAVQPMTVDIPSAATQVFVRFFVSGHGGGSDPGCPNPADEFCPRYTHIDVDGMEVWGVTPWNECPDDCRPWNACGFPSCTYPRSGWCPGFITCHTDDPCDQDLDLTSALAPGGTYDIKYWIDDIGNGGSWSYSLILYWYE